MIYASTKPHSLTPVRNKAYSSFTFGGAGEFENQTDLLAAGSASSYSLPSFVFVMKDFENIYQKHLNAVFRFSLHCVGRREIAEEITSEAFLALYRNLEGIDEARLPSWLFTVARNRALDYWRRSALEQRPRDSPETTATKSLESGLDYALFRSRALKPAHRVCLILRYVYGMSRGEIANQTGLSEIQIKGHLQHALQILRKELQKETGQGVR